MKKSCWQSDAIINTYSKWYEGIVLFGAGVTGTRFAGTLKKYNCFLGYLDNDPYKVEHGYNSEAVKSLNEYMRNPHGFIVITASVKGQVQISKQLEDAGLKNKVDFCSYETFLGEVFPVMSYFVYHKIFMKLAQICLTERCTLKCHKCAHGCFNVKSTSNDMTIEEAKRSADAFFTHIDYVHEFVLLGGEPLLYSNLSEILEYIGEKYRNQMDIFSITSNGTILPDDKILALCNKYHVLYRISNYESQVPYLKEKYEKLINLLVSNGIDNQLGKAGQTWMDYGFGYLNRNASEEELIEIFDQCKTPCREVRGNKLYFCVMARSISDNLHYNVGQDDYLDLDQINTAEDKIEILKFNLGYSEKGYIDMCEHCYGKEAVQHPIPAGVQVKNEDKGSECHE